MVLPYTRPVPFNSMNLKRDWKYTHIGGRSTPYEKKSDEDDKKRS